MLQRQDDLPGIALSTNEVDALTESATPTQLVPFGKYRGQPVEVLAQDQDYCEWLTKQAWFRERYSKVYAVVINHGQQPTETPDHNRIQALFLDDDFRRAFVHYVVPSFGKLSDVGMIDSSVQFESNGWDAVVLPKCKWRSEYEKAACESLGVNHDKLPLKYWCPGISLSSTIRVEIKPSLGDDYPAVLRQMKSYGLGRYWENEFAVLFVEDISCRGASDEQITAFFKNEHIKLVHATTLGEYRCALDTVPTVFHYAEEQLYALAEKGLFLIPASLFESVSRTRQEWSEHTHQWEKLKAKRSWLMECNRHDYIEEAYNEYLKSLHSQFYWHGNKELIPDSPRIAAWVKRLGGQIVSSPDQP